LAFWTGDEHLEKNKKRVGKERCAKQRNPQRQTARATTTPTKKGWEGGTNKNLNDTHKLEPWSVSSFKDRKNVSLPLENEITRAHKRSQVREGVGDRHWRKIMKKAMLKRERDTYPLLLDNGDFSGSGTKERT